MMTSVPLAQPDKQHAERLERLPFEALFILPDETSQKNQAALEPYFDKANSCLGKMTKGPPLNDIRFDCNKKETAVL